MEIKYIFLLIALLTIGIIILPSIYSTFTGQHSFIDTIDTGNIDTGSCIKCHSDIRKELDASNIHNNLLCEICHVSNSNSNLNNSDLHGNVIIPRCLDCHKNIIQYLDKDSHKPLILNFNSYFKKGENEACISCHTTKSLQMGINFFNSYHFKAKRNLEWQMSDYSKDTSDIVSFLIIFNGTSGVHTFPSLSELRCEKCHMREKEHLENSNSHRVFSCNMCHQLNKGEVHTSNIPLCIYCHFYILEGNDRIGLSEADAHYPFVFNANKSGEKNLACLSCHSSFNNNIAFIRPEFIEWNIKNKNGSWFIENLTIGPNKEIKINKKLDGKLHNISIDNGKNCVYCHEDIKNAVISGGHSRTEKHNVDMNGLDMNTYCRSCHSPYTSNDNQESPYPAYPFNSITHGAMKLSCLDCHTKSGLNVNMNGGMKKPPYDSKSMGYIEKSISNQSQFIQSYICIACKNTDNPFPDKNSSMHFKIFTEPQVKIYINGTQRYP